MNNNQFFCHLHNHTEHSMLDGMGTCNQYARKAKQMGFEYLGCTDHGSVSGLIQFQNACDKEGIKPILGCELYIVGDLKSKDKANHMTVFVKDRIGWQNLLQILSYANLQGFYRRPRVDNEYFLKHCKGLIILTGCGDTFLRANWGLDFLDQLDQIISDPNDLYFEVMPHNIDFQKQANEIVLGLMDKFSEPGYALPLAATNDCHYVESEDWETQEVLLAIQRGAKWNDPNRWKFNIKGLYLRSVDEMVQEFKVQDILNNEEINDAMKNTLEIAEKCCNFRIEKQTMSLPRAKGYEDDADKLLIKLCHEGLRGELLLFQEYKERFREEYKLIKDKKFSQYFIIVKELIDWCKENAILVGPGRGSVGGCLIAYLLGITDVNPIEYNLLFSRFIAPDRQDFPDIDLDFEDTKRYLIRQHLEEMYGVNNIANIATFLRMKGKGAIRDVCRVFDVSLKEADEFAKIIDEGIMEGVNTDTGKKFVKKYPYVIHHAMKLEGQIRGYGKHAAGIIVSAENLTKGTRCNLIKRGNEGIAINWEMNDAEYVGLMKLDVLGLSTLTVLGECKRLINENHGNQFVYHEVSDSYSVVGKIEDELKIVEFNFDKIPLNDPKVYGDLSAGHTVGTFQFSGFTCTEWIKKMGVGEFEHLVQLISIARPGPLDSGMTDLFIRRKHGESWQKKHQRFENITQETYGVIVYQEQVMEVINKVAGLPYATADKIRKIIGKKRDAKEFKPYKDSFIKGCLEQKTFTEKQANDFWEELQYHASYSFNRSHAVEYALIGYWTSWLKLNFTKEFLCATLTYEPDSKKNALVKEAQRLGFSVMPPKAGISEAIRWIAKGNILYAPFVSIKGIGEKKALEAAGLKRPISKGNNSGFFKIVESEKKKKTQLESLLEEIGAFDQGVPKGISQYFSFTISSEPRILYPNLFQLFSNIKPSQVDEIVKGNVKIPNIIKKIRFDNDYLLDCTDCELSKECSAPVMPNKGLYNIMIVGEAPGKTEDLQGKGFIGTAGEILWKELGKHGLNRMKFHITNCVKCYPSKTKTPTKIHIQKCLPWLQEEMETIDCRLILALGNTAIMAFLDELGGITKKNGNTEWLDKWKCWISWCIHPASVARNPGNKEMFQLGIKNFVETLRKMGIDEILY